MNCHAGDEWKKKWRNLRDTYMKQRKYVNSTNSDEGAKKKRKWRYFDLMQFIEPYVEVNR